MHVVKGKKIETQQSERRRPQHVEAIPYKRALVVTRADKLAPRLDFGWDPALGVGLEAAGGQFLGERVDKQFGAFRIVDALMSERGQEEDTYDDTEITS